MYITFQVHIKYSYLLAVTNMSDNTPLDLLGVYTPLLQTKIPEIPIFGNATSRHANLTKFCRNINIDVRNKP